jgi:hypothetical protein
MTRCSVLERAVDGYRGVPEIVPTVDRLIVLKGRLAQTTEAKA